MKWNAHTKYRGTPRNTAEWPRNTKYRGIEKDWRKSFKNKTSTSSYTSHNMEVTLLTCKQNRQGILICSKYLLYVYNKADRKPLPVLPEIQDAKNLLGASPFIPHFPPQGGGHLESINWVL